MHTSKVEYLLSIHILWFTIIEGSVFMFLVLWQVFSYFYVHSSAIDTYKIENVGERTFN